LGYALKFVVTDTQSLVAKLLVISAFYTSDYIVNFICL